MSRSFYDDSWKESYDLQFKNELLSEKNWCENVKETGTEDMVIHIRLKQHPPEPEPEIIHPSSYAPTHLAPPPPPILPIIPPTNPQSQYDIESNIAAQCHTSALATIPYGPPGSQVAPQQDPNTYSFRLPPSYLSQPARFQPRFRPNHFAYGQHSSYGNTSNYSAPARLSFKQNNSMTKLASLANQNTSDYTGYVYRPSKFETATESSSRYASKTPWLMNDQ